MNKPKSKLHGGKRSGAGRKSGTGRYGEKTTAIRVPNSYVPYIKELLSEVREKAKRESVVSKNQSTSKIALNDDVQILKPAENLTQLKRPLFQSVAAGFPSPAGDYIEGQLDLNEHFIARPSSTFFVRVTGESMSGVGILPDDVLIVDRSLEAQHGNIVIAVVGGELTVKRLFKKSGRIELRPENIKFRPILCSPEMELEIWGVVSGVTRKL